METPYALDGGNEAVAATGDGLDVPGCVDVIADRPPQLRDGLSQRVVGDVRVGPEGVEERVLRHERAGTLEEIHEQVEQLRGEIERVTAPPDAVGDAVDQKGPEPVRRLSHRSWRKMLLRWSRNRARADGLLRAIRARGSGFPYWMLIEPCSPRCRVA